MVIGNPPYVRQEMLGKIKGYFEKDFKVFHGVADLYTYFIERGVSLLKSGGLFSYIVANKWMRANYGLPMRRWLKQQCIKEIVDFGDLPVFKKATTYPCIIRISKGSPQSAFNVSQVKNLDFESLESYVSNNNYKVKRSLLEDAGWSLTDNRTHALLKKLQSVGVPLSKYVNGKICYGIKTGLNKAFVIDAATKDRLIKEDPKSAELIKPLLIGKDIKKYQVPVVNQFLILIPKGWTRLTSKQNQNNWKWLKNNYRSIAKHLAPFEVEACKRCDKGEYWWELRACDYYNKFEKPKIIYPNICKKPEFLYDTKRLFTNQKCFIIPLPDKYLLGLLNSSVTFFLFQKILPKLRGDFYEPSYVFLKDFPIRTIDFSNSTDKTRHKKMVKLVDGMLELNKQVAKAKPSHNKTVLQRQIEATDRQIDQLVYELYGLTDKEVKIVEEG